MVRKGFALLLASALAIGGLFYPSGSPPTTVSRTRPPGAAETRPHIAEAYGGLPLSFEANRGQADPQVRFLARGPQQTLFLTPSQAVLALAQPAPAALKPLARGTPQPPAAAHGTVLRLTFVGANPAPRMTGQDQLPGRAHYLIGNDPARWRTNVPTYAKVHYHAVYPGVDVVHYGTQGHLEHDFLVAPGADPRVITIGVGGARHLSIDAAGNLVLALNDGEVRFQKPVIYQDVDGVRREISGGYVLRGLDQVGFQVAAYDPTRPLVIDPALAYSTFLNGVGDNSWGGIAVDAAGSAYVTGPASSTNFPTTPGRFKRAAAACS